MRAFTLFITSLAFSCLMFLAIPTSNATHFMGVDIAYQCLPNSNGCVYRISHNTYYDCAGAATTQLPGTPFSPTLQTFQPASCSQPTMVGQWTLISYMEVTPICPTHNTQCTNPTASINGVLEAKFYADYDFCNVNCSTYQIIWGSCCRNGTISSGSANDGIYSGSTEINLGLSSCNNSPYFTSEPIPYICSGTGAIIDQGAFDPDGDSLAFSLIACQDNAISQIGYNAGFSATQPLGPSWQFNLNSQTGELVIAPNPGNVVTGVACIEVEEFRNGVKIGSITRDMQITVLICPGVNQAPLKDSVKLVSGGLEVGTNHFELCGSDTLELAIHASDPDATQTVSLRTTTGIPGLKLSGSPANPIVGTLKFANTQLGTYYIPVVVVDNHCPIPSRQLFTIQVDVKTSCLSAAITDAPCGSATGAIDLSVGGGTAPYSYAWSAGATTQDITGLLPGSYSVTVTDAAGFIQTASFTVSATNISLTLAVLGPNCSNPNSGAVGALAGGGVAPYTYLWNTGATTSLLTNVPAGGYSVTVLDANGCPRHAATVIDPPDSCYNVIKGFAYEDANSNCIFDAGEAPIPNMIIDATPGGAVMTDANGAYEIRVATGTFDVKTYPRQWQTLLCPTTGSYTVPFVSYGNVQSNVNFALQTATVQEISVDVYTPRVRPGDTASHFLTVRNNGSVTVSGGVTWVHDAIFDFISANPSAGSYSAVTNTASWSFTNLGPYQSLSYRIEASIDSTTALGLGFSNSATVVPITNDAIPSNNSMTVIDTVRGAFDPNDKMVTPAGIGPLGLIEQTEQEMTYTVRFQNTGTDTAFYVYIRDTIDTEVLDIFSFERRQESHPYNLRIENDTVLVFRFLNINLPDSGTNMQGSQGFVQFALSHKGTLPIGTEIRNTAAIYFDFNAPVITNTVLNTVFAYPEVDLGRDTTICEGQPIPVQITSHGLPPYEFRWSNGHIDANNTAGISQTVIGNSGVYQVTVTDALGVEVVESVFVTADPMADAKFNYSLSGLQMTFDNPAAGNSTWEWDFGDGNKASGGANQVHTYASLSTYTVTLIVSNDCGRDTLIKEIDLRTVSLDDALFAQSITLLPHPVRDVSYLRFANPENEFFQLRILDLQGREVRRYAPHRGDVFEIAVGDLASGIYVYELSGSHSYYGKMMLK